MVSPANTANCNDGGSGKCNMLVSATLSGSVFAWNADTGTTLGATVRARVAPTIHHGSTTAVRVVRLHGLGTGRPGFRGYCFHTRDRHQRRHAGDVYHQPVPVSAGGTAGVQWWIHEIDLTTGLDVCAGGTWSSGVCSGNRTAYPNPYPPGSARGCPFQAWQSCSGRLCWRSPIRARAGSSNLIYIAFGSGQGEMNSPYHGWIFGYNGTPTCADASVRLQYLGRHPSNQ